MADQTVRIDVIARAQTAAFGKAGEDLRRFGKTTTHTAKESSTAMTKLGNVAGIAGTAILLGVGAALAVGAKAAIDFESQFAGVRKTVDASEATFQQLATTLRGMALEIPIPVADLARIAELGGQLGVPVKNLEEFTEVIAKMGVTTDLSIEEASTGFARFANVMGTSLSDVDRLGSTVVDLGNNFATTESEILTFGLRLAGIGSVIGLTESDVLGLATAFTSLGEPAERGATAVQRTFIEMQKAIQAGGEDLALFAEVAGMAADEFATLFAEDPAQAFIAFEKGLARVNAEGGSVTQVLQELGLGSQRTLGLLLKGASGWETLADAVGTASDAYSDNIALDIEAEKRFGTTASQITLMANSFKDLNIEIGQSTTSIVTFAVGALAEFFTLIKENLHILEALMPMIGLLAAGKILSKMGNAFLDLGIKVGKSTPILRAFVGGLDKLMLTTKVLGLALGVTAVALVAFGLALATERNHIRRYQESVENTADAFKNWKSGITEFSDVYEAFVAQLNEKTGIFDITIDLEKYRRDILSMTGLTAEGLVNLAINDTKAFDKLSDDVMTRLQTQIEGTREDIALLSSVGTDTTVQQMRLDALIERQALWKNIIKETEAATAALRAEQKLQMDELLASVDVVNERRIFSGFDGAPANVTDQFLSDLKVSADDYAEILTDMKEDTADFVDDFISEWDDLTSSISDRLFDWGSAWNEYESIQALKTSELKKSLTNWVTDQQRLSNTLLFITENFSQDMVNLWLSLPADLQSHLAAALAVSPELFEEQFGLITDTNEALFDIFIADLLNLTETGASMLGPMFLNFFRGTIIPAALEAGEEGGVTFVNTLVQGMADFDAELANEAPEVREKFHTWIQDIVDKLNMSGISTNAIEALTADMTTAEKVQWFQSVGLSWEEAAVLGWYSADLPSILAENAKDTADHIATAPELHDKFVQAGLTWSEKANTGWMMTNLPHPETKQLADAELKDKFYQAGLEWKTSAVTGFSGIVSELADKARQAANQAKESAAEALGAQSPSKVFMELGKDVGDGFNIGLAKSLVGPAEGIFASLKPNMSQLAKVDHQTPALLDAIGGLANVGGSRETNVIFNGNVENEGEVMRKVQKGTALAGLTQIAETAPGRS